MRRIPLLASSLLLALTLGAPAQEPDRFTLERSGDGFVRLDRGTGEISNCADQAGQLVCRVAADERLAFEDELDRLRSTLDALEKRVAALEGEAGSKLPDSEEFDQTMGYIQRFFRGFMDIVREFENEFSDKEPTEPQRT